ncbi:helix-turn-helix domain-containing protein [Hymenobacter psychrophilus]|uniref:AraC-type DNA-binding protein n=1 Tax=Hymenobacter psychrophilus TaxID=651662 RepID=A0A1H3BH87_9BACT|nr:helix-turn-helix transcriptional regulator [Hymenobacter psychrophilus]SDX40744.1 AraC-type DNA-binding protein [Hymenobacter psychrophilus]
MHDRSLIQVISMLAVFIAGMLALFLLTVPTRHRLSNRLFGTFILLNALDISSWFLNRHLLPYPGLLVFKITTNTLINPVFYLYALAVCYSDFRLKPRHLWHLLPFGLLTLGLLPRFYLVDAAAKLHFLENFRDQPESVVIRWLGELQFLVYTAAIFIILKKYKQAYQENYTNPASITYKWLFQLTATLTLLHVVVVVKNGLQFTDQQDWFAGFELLVGINATCVLSWFILKALYHPALFRGVDSTLEPVGALLAGEPAASKATEALAPPQTETQVQQLRNYMAQAEPYLNPDLTVQELATQLNWPVRELSVLINHHLGQHFFDFVNEYRITKSMHLLKDASQPQLTVLEILYAVGFNSKSSFNTSFKKHTGQTPTQYRSA